MNTNRTSKTYREVVLLAVKNDRICSFTEFSPFCSELYYFSNFKDFNTLTKA